MKVIVNHNKPKNNIAETKISLYGINGKITRCDYKLDENFTEEKGIEFLIYSWCLFFEWTVSHLNKSNKKNLILTLINQGQDYQNKTSYLNSPKTINEKLLVSYSLFLYTMPDNIYYIIHNISISEDCKIYYGYMRDSNEQLILLIYDLVLSKHPKNCATLICFLFSYAFYKWEAYGYPHGIKNRHTWMFPKKDLDQLYKELQFNKSKIEKP